MTNKLYEIARSRYVGIGCQLAAGKISRKQVAERKQNPQYFQTTHQERIHLKCAFNSQTNEIIMSITIHVCACKQCPHACTKTCETDVQCSEIMHKLFVSGHGNCKYKFHGLIFHRHARRKYGLRTSIKIHQFESLHWNLVGGNYQPNIFTSSGHVLFTVLCKYIEICSHGYQLTTSIL